MSFAEIKQAAEKLTSAEVLFLAAYFHHLSRRKDPSYLAGLDEAWLAAESGDRISLDELRRIEREASGAGL